MFIPLVDLTKQNGPTEFAAGSHLDWRGLKPAPIFLKAGEFCVFDFRVRHRGLGNNDSAPRPLVYLTYARKDFEDAFNFSADRYAPLPALVEQRSLQPRASS